jgi:hypothetical protein
MVGVRGFYKRVELRKEQFLKGKNITVQSLKQGLESAPETKAIFIALL